MDDEPPLSPEDAATLRFLKRLVTVLTTVMIGGVIVLITLLVIRLPQSAPPFPDSIALPDGTVAEAFTRGRGWYAVVTGAQEILIFDATSGALRQRIEITP
ncbi:DUF6476 family protein [Poseidonocella sedimentorum]|uniref:Uncharacterized protein n=1 Tax=Poseidonocella sedimentorum TaxID=871652 RepID=A0A1I6DY84_9RHOB|nr:DUF6476 family protein [Poseidonocella sedimentorum]SFR10484.1 hypothetical protein SAMN04515673_10670 [Poseidonocella sedimentorum]